MSWNGLLGIRAVLFAVLISFSISYLSLKNSLVTESDVICMKGVLTNLDSSKRVVSTYVRLNPDKHENEIKGKVRISPDRNLTIGESYDFCVVESISLYTFIPVSSNYIYFVRQGYKASNFAQFTVGSYNELEKHLFFVNLLSLLAVYFLIIFTFFNKERY